MSNKYLDCMHSDSDKLAALLGGLIQVTDRHPCTACQAMIKLTRYALECAAENDECPPEVVRALAHIDAAKRALDDFEERVCQELAEEEDE